MKVAIIGSGISGLTSAYLLHKEHDLTVFEAAGWVGGHTHTVGVSLQGRDYLIDTGFIVFNEWTHPNFIRLLEGLGVALKPTDMSFSVTDPLSGLEYKGNDLNSLFAQRSNLFSPSFWSMVRDILRFNKESLDDYTNQRIAPHVTLGEYLRLGAYSQRFVDHYIVPMGASIWSMPQKEMLGFPLVFFVRLFKSHGLLSVSQRPQWYAIEGGSSAYVKPLIKGFSQRVRLKCPVFEVHRDRAGVTVVSALGAQRFDKVIFACHSDQALKLLNTPTAAEQQILGALRYADNDVVLHTDTRLLPKRSRAWASWNYRLGGAADQLAAVTYNMNQLQGIEGPETFCVSLNQTNAIDPSRIIRRCTYAHPQYSLDGMAAQMRADELSGPNHSYFCGAYWGNGFHEDGVASAMKVANALCDVGLSTTLTTPRLLHATHRL